MTRAYLVVAAISGAVWACAAIVLDGATEADHSWAIPWQDPLALALIIPGGAIVGVSVGALVRRPLQARSRLTPFLPLVTLPLAIALFATLVWASRAILGYHFTPQLSRRAELGLILETYLVYGLVSLMTPLLYVLALLNQRMIRATA